MNKKAFTLMELMVVVLIIAILAAIAIPLYNHAIDNQNNTRAKAILRTINGGMERFNREYPDVAIPTASDAFVINPPANASCSYFGENNLSAQDFIAQMVACGYIPRQNYGTATHQENDGALDYRFRLQDPNNGNLTYGLGYVFMEPKPNAKVGNKYCLRTSQGGAIVCRYKAGIGMNGAIVEITQ